MRGTPKSDRGSTDSPASRGESTPGNISPLITFEKDSFSPAGPESGPGFAQKKRRFVPPPLQHIVAEPATTQTPPGQVTPRGTGLVNPKQAVPEYDSNSAQLLGKGAFGSVFKATGKDGRAFVVKEMDIGIIAHRAAGGGVISEENAQEHLQKMQVEAKALAMLHGIPHVPKFLGSDQQSGIYRIAMEHVEAPSMEKGQLPEPQVKQAIYQLLKTLDAAHHATPEVCVAHLDVKPANMLWDGKNLTLIDWGETRLFKPGQTKIEQNLSAGTSAYRPKFSEKGDDAVFLDTYAAGKTLETLLATGKRAISAGAKQFIDRCTAGEPIEELLKDPWIHD